MCEKAQNKIVIVEMDIFILECISEYCFLCCLTVIGQIRKKFFQNEELKQRISKKEIQKIWQQSIQCFENYLNHEIRNKAENGQSLQAVRQEISERCYEEAEKETRLYRLTVPTGAGKTLSSLRFALYRAERTQKQHIIYVAPFNSILSQNCRMRSGEQLTIRISYWNIIAM